MTTIRRFAPATEAGAHGGVCAICETEAVAWQRTGLCAGGLVRAAYACAEHAPVLLEALRGMTLAEVAEITSTRTTRAARARAARLRDRADRYARRSAALVGASSATHTAAILQGSDLREAAALDRLADLVRA